MGEMADYILDRAFDAHTCLTCFEDMDWCLCDGPGYLPHDPECPGEEIVRTNKRTLQRFVGCTEFPQCRWTREHQLQPGDFGYVPTLSQPKKTVKTWVVNLHVSDVPHDDLPNDYWDEQIHPSWWIKIIVKHESKSEAIRMALKKLKPKYVLDVTTYEQEPRGFGL